MISQVSRFLCLTLLSAGAVAVAQQVPPLNDTPPTLSLPPLPKLGDKPAAAAPEKPALPPSVPAKPELKPTTPKLDTDRQTSKTTDGQFVIHGADLATRTWFSTQCETIASDLRKLLRDPAPWSIPVNVSIRTGNTMSLAEPAVKMQVLPLAPSGFQLQVNVQMRADFNSNELRTELIRVLLAERILRDHDQLISTRRPVLPEWFFTGVTEALRFRERARPSATFAAVFKTGKVFGIEDILGMAPTSMDALTRTIYETSSCAFVLMLLDQPEGNLRMAKFLGALAVDSRSDRDVLNQWFPGLAASKSSLEKWWSLQMAHMARPSVWETLDPQETAKALELALAYHYETEVDASEPVVRRKAAAPEDKPEDAEEEKRSFFGRLFGGSSKAEEQKDKPKEKEKEKEKDRPKPEKAPEPKAEDQTARVPLFTRLFGGSDDKKKEEPKKAAKKDEKKLEPKKVEPKKETPKPKPPPEPKKEDSKKPEPKKAEAKKKDDENKPAQPGILRRFFSSSDKDKEKEKPKAKDESKSKPAPAPEKKKDEAKKEDEKKSASTGDQIEGLRLLARVAADVLLPNATTWLQVPSFVSASSPRPVILGFGKKKSEEEIEQEKKDKEAKAKADAEKAAKAKADKEKADAEKAAKKKADADKKKKEDDERKAAAAASKNDKKPAPKKEETKKEEPGKETAKKEPEPEPAPKPAAAKKRKVMANAPVEDFAKILKRPDGKAILAATAADLAALGHRAHPLFQPIIADYIKLIAQLATPGMKEADATAQFKSLRERTAAALKQARAVQDYVDFVEASENTKWSGTFDDYLRLKETINNELPKRSDPLSRLLDEAEKQGQK